MKPEKTQSHAHSSADLPGGDDGGGQTVGDSQGRHGGLGLPDDRIIGEIAHEMGNYFHKLYYWTDYLRQGQVQQGASGGVEADIAALDMLEGTVERLDRFMRMILEYFSPARLCFNKMSGADLVAALERRLPGRQLRLVGIEDWRQSNVLADPGLIGHAIRTVFERVASSLLDEDEMVIRLTCSRRREFRGLEIAFEAGIGGTTETDLTSGIEMAVAEKFFQMHGGELFERIEGRRALVVFLPIYA